MRSLYFLQIIMNSNKSVFNSFKIKHVLSKRSSYPSILLYLSLEKSLYSGERTVLPSTQVNTTTRFPYDLQGISHSTQSLSISYKVPEVHCENNNCFGTLSERKKLADIYKTANTKWTQDQIHVLESNE